MLSRRSFFATLGAAIAGGPALLKRAALAVPRPALLTNWFQSSRMSRCTSAEYDAALEKIVRDSVHDGCRTKWLQQFGYDIGPRQ